MSVDDLQFFRSLLLQSQNAISLGRFEDSLILLKRLEQECLERNMIELLCSTYSAMAEAYRQLDNRLAAIDMFYKSCEACREVLKDHDSNKYILIKQNLRASLGNLADLIRDTGDLYSALPIYKEMESVAQSLNEMNWIQASLNNQGFIYMKLKKYELALEAFEKQEKICRQEKIKGDLGKSLYFQALIYNEKKDIKEFYKLFKNIERLSEENNEYRIYLDELKRLELYNSIRFT